MSTNKEWLPHIINSLPEKHRGYALSSYAMVLEAWRRGIDVTYLYRNQRKSELFYRLTYKGKEHLFQVAKGDFVTKEAVSICKDKQKAKEHLLKAKVPTPIGNIFEENEKNSAIIKQAKKIKYPVVIKPYNGTGGKGVIANIKNKNELIDALKYVREDLNLKKVILEKHVAGEDYRVYVIDNQVIGAIKRIPANIYTDGVNTVRELIKLKNVERSKNPSLVGRNIKIDKETKNMLKEQNLTLDSVPKKGEQIFLKSKNNVSAGGDSIDVTDSLTKEVKNVAIKANKAIPNLVHSGVDLMVDEKANKAYVIEINSRPHITAQLFPMQGKARDIPKAIIDYYFPETKKIAYKPYLNFNFETIWQDFRTGRKKKYTLPSHPTGELAITRFLVEGNINDDVFVKDIENMANRLSLHGYLKVLDSNRIAIIITGNIKEVQQFTKSLNSDLKEKYQLENIIEKKRKSAVMMGFEVIKDGFNPTDIEGYHPVRFENMTKLYNKTAQRNLNRKKSNQKVRQKDSNKSSSNKKANSRTWKIAKPVRILGKIIRNR
ncbi:MAG TPA: ATP-grasp domain-containing protein [Pseudogracilibacillus sp.]|nr:ATP-grasp domain-containing protein [Pseudogracilibacillus sp.]